jgi:hypothetical protein
LQKSILKNKLAFNSNQIGNGLAGINKKESMVSFSEQAIAATMSQA